MTYLVVRLKGKLIEQRQVDADKAKRGFKIRIGSLGKVFIKMGEPVVLGDYEVKVIEVPSSNSISSDQPQSFPTISQDLTATSKDISTDQSGEPYPQIEDYTILGQLGAGGMGTVWRAIQLSTKREVALKMLAQRRFKAKKAQRRFEREVALAAKLTHANIARIYDSGVHRGLYYYAMELIDGIQLDRYAEEKKLGHEAILKLVHKVCDALESAHGLGIVHCDLKPSNILVTSDGEPHVLDFGLAKPFTKEDWNITISMDNDIIGTPAYMAPEQAAGHHQDIDKRTDVYSLGVILYQLLTKDLPRDMSGSRYEVLKRIVEQDVIRPRDADDSITHELECILLRALAQRKENRYATVGELGDDIGNYLSGAPLLAEGASAIYLLRTRLRSRRLGVFGVLLIGILLFVLVYIMFIRPRQEKRPEDVPVAALSTFETILEPTTKKVDHGVMSPFILYDPNAPGAVQHGPYRMWYLEYTQWTAGEHWIGHAWSKDGCVWTHREIVHTADRRGDIIPGYQRTDCPIVIKTSEGYRLYNHRYYFHGPRPCAEWAGCMEVSFESSDGISFAKHEEHVLDPLYMAGGWDNYEVRPSTVLDTGGQYVLYYTSVGDTGQFSGKSCIGGIGRAVSPDGMTWPSQEGPDRQLVMGPGASGDWDRYVVEPCVIHRGRGPRPYWMFFRAGNKAGWSRGAGAIGFTASTDGIHWGQRTRLFNEADWLELADLVDGLIAMGTPRYFEDPQSGIQYLYFSYSFYDDAVQGPLTNIGRVVLQP